MSILLPPISLSYTAPAFAVGRAASVRGTANTAETTPNAAANTTANASKKSQPITDTLDLSVSASLAKRVDDEAVPAVGRVAEKRSQAEKTESEDASAETMKSSETVKSGQSGKTGTLTADQEAQVSKLKARDTEVRAHEQAHLAAAGQYANGGASFSYETGPDGQRYAVGGEVSIDASPIKGDPEATISKAQQIRSAALAPASPSSQDYKVAAAASEMEANARLQKPSGLEGKSRVGLGQAISPESPDGTKTAETTKTDATAKTTEASSNLLAASPISAKQNIAGVTESSSSPASAKSSMVSSAANSVAANSVAAAYLQNSTLASRFSIFA
ncbi:MAG: putative metalloprotease CJM1_0395 family protein [Thermoguttaceae bacterium]